MFRFEWLAFPSALVMFFSFLAFLVPAGEPLAKPVVEARLRPLACAYETGEVPQLTLELRNLSDRILRIPRCPTLLTLEIDGETFRPRGPSTTPYVAGLAPGERSKTIALPVEIHRPGVGWVELAPGKHRIRVLSKIHVLGAGRTVETWTEPVDVELRPRPSEAPGPSSESTWSRARAGSR